MSFSDVVSAAGLAVFAKVGLALFVSVFIAMMVRTWLVFRPARAAAAAALPLFDDGATCEASVEENRMSATPVALDRTRGGAHS